ncbi:MAG TPA: hypothetical protein VFJ74_04170 [Gemmatimonadaceae bacterium]|nr:hypothetical protein [Gemmatimonadaceae bacterium]
MSRFATAITAAATAASLSLAAPSRASAQQQSPSSSMREYEYTFRVSSSRNDDSPTIGTMRVSGDRGRIDIEGNKEGQFLLVTDGGRTLTVVHPDKREYEVTNAAEFERIVGTALRAVGPVVSISLESAHVAADHLGDGGAVAGRPTVRARLAQDFVVRVRAFGFGGDADHQIVTTEYWFSPGLTLMRNPLLGLMEDAEAALAQGDTAYVRVVADERNRLLGGATPLRRVVTSRGDKGKSSTQTLEITSLRATHPDPRIFEIPAGYKRGSGITWSASSR